MAEQPTDEGFEITEVDDGNLEEVPGGLQPPDHNLNCGPYVCNLACNCPLDGGP